jgi:dolichol-phosphate mannosyltransferase
MTSISIVVPTYKEAENLVALCKSLDEVMAQTELSYELLIVDDQSPDDTVAIAKTLAEQYPLRLIQPDGRERDLSLSVLDGLREAASDVVVVMDADLSHPVEKVPELVGILAGSDKIFVAGSRYVAGGQFDGGWSFWRFLNSWFATLLALPLTRCSDPMTGFFAIRKQDLPDLEKLRPIGYKIALELMVRGEFGNIKEVPIAFKDRAAGDSKMNLRQQLNYIRHLRRLYLYKFRGWAEFIHYGAVGASGFIIDIFFYYALQLFGIEHRVARALSFWPAVSWNWALNRVTTFGERERRPRARQWAEFVATSLVGFSMNWGIYALLTAKVAFFDEYKILALISGIIGASVFNFTASTLFVYSEKRGV